MAIFGCRNGYVYALSMSDGELIWRFRAAPVDRRTVVRDRVESVWPVHGSVLVVNGTVYFAAGHSSYLDGGIRIYGLDVGTGDVKYSTTLRSDGASKDGSLPDVLISDGQNITMRFRNFDLSLKETGRPRPATMMTNTGLLEDCWGHRWNWDLGGGDAFGKLLAFNGETACGVQTYYTFLKYDKTMQPVLGNVNPNLPDETQPWSLCISRGDPQYLWAADQHPGRIYKLSLGGEILGMLGTSGKQLGQFNWIHGLDCSQEGVLYVADLNNWRIQKLILNP